jgi:uncharacterized integral membrane protein (TIGR00697 family)
VNEALFLLHLAIVFAFTLGALRMGRLALFAWTCSQAVFANLFVLKQMSCFSLTITCSDVYAVGGMLGLNLMQEYFGSSDAKKAAKSCFYLLIFFAAMAKIHLAYQPSALDITHPAYVTILSAAPRLLFASLASFFIVQQIDIRFFGALKARFPLSPLAIRNTISLLTSQLLDTVLFSILGLHGIVENTLDIIIVSFLIKAMVIFSSLSVTTLSKKMTIKDAS